MGFRVAPVLEIRKWSAELGAGRVFSRVSLQLGIVAALLRWRKSDGK